MGLEIPGLRERVQAEFRRSSEARKLETGKGWSVNAFTKAYPELGQQGVNEWVSDTARAKSNPSIEGLKRFAKVCGKPWEWFVVGDEGMEVLRRYHAVRYALPPPRREAEPEPPERERERAPRSPRRDSAKDSGVE